MSIHLFDDKEAVSGALAEYLSQRIHQLLKQQPLCHIALSGGSTPKRAFEIMATMAFPWHQIHFYLSDERCYPPDHPDRNDVMINQTLWSKIDIPASNLHPMRSELGNEAGAKDYTQVIQDINALDIILLGMGEDGHTASLFPNNPGLEDQRPAIPVDHSPKPPKQRISLSAKVIKAGKERIVLACGASKFTIIQAIIKSQTFPVSSVGSCRWYLDKAAIGDLSIDTLEQLP